MTRLIQLLIFGHIHHWEKDGVRIQVHHTRIGYYTIHQPCRCVKCGVLKTFEVLA